jgi:hypothetical protein
MNLSRQVGHGTMNLDVHLVERFLHPLHTACSFGNQISHLSL